MVIILNLKPRLTHLHFEYCYVILRVMWLVFIYMPTLPRKAAMISVELWRATIGLSSSNCYSGSISSLSYLSSFKFRVRAKRSSSDVVRQEEPPGPTYPSLSPHRVVPPNSSPRSSESLIQQSLRSLSSFIHVHCSFHCGLHLLQHTLVRLVLAILVIISQSLIISGDIELNPGPDPSESC